ncbi:four-carbon acid sugar kinase family protein (plasmid) [Paraburkholderia sprentiae WSM5005]|uniref:Four-carbon acid sugar kinase family protein n=1 Tax=Paraburkholderia sprentiae WSM5005 TaxID=754502 RepID=A0A1I9YU30_9BURK|nr:3-oxo-isoapionate kinase OiaK [Paraburkholderia sprentiae]APA89723.1 four-carbon acid sugar kinase family protein [Paraburkholderia sprentiae WSM5005]
MSEATDARWPDGLLLAYYGDDFTGSTDAMEAMSAAGVPTLLCFDVPTPELLARFPGVRCVGLAGSSRGRSPQWMDDELPRAFASLAALGAPILQYKVCSTFDSSPDTGSIGRAIDIGVRQMPGRWSPMVVGAPRLKRYQAFGNLFAAVDGTGYRLDRHPTMSRHPVTPMNEADLRVHLARQTPREIGLIDFVQLASPDAAARLRTLQRDDPPVVLIDVLDEASLAAAGRLVWEQRGAGVFSASSSGLQYALTAHWRALGLVPASPGLPVAGPVDAIAAVSGSCSPVTAGQIRWARENGFRVERLDLRRALDADTREAEVERAVQVSIDALSRAQSSLVFSAEGPDDPDVLGFDDIAACARLTRAQAARRVGEALADVMLRTLERAAVSRVVVAGGDSSGEVASRLGIAALSVAAGMAPGSPLCRAWSDDPARDGLEIALKGGQVGAASFFGSVRAGRLLE